MATAGSVNAKGAVHSAPMTREEKKVIFASSLGTVFEWYDFYLYGSLAGFITKHFFSGVNETTGYIFALLAFAAGFAVRPLGAVIDLDPRPAAANVTSLPRGRGRPSLGVVPREVTLLPRHWEWLAAQPGGASVALRKLVEAARKDPRERARACWRSSSTVMSNCSCTWLMTSSFSRPQRPSPRTCSRKA